MTQHHQAELSIEFGSRVIEAETDEGIAELVMACWAAGWPTQASCEDMDGRGWIAFASPLSARALYALAQQAGIPLQVIFEFTDEHKAKATDKTDYGYNEDTTAIAFSTTDIERLTALVGKREAA